MNSCEFTGRKAGITIPESAPISPAEIANQVARLCKDYLPARQAALLKFLVSAPNRPGYEDLTPPEILIKFEEEELTLEARSRNPSAKEVKIAEDKIDAQLQTTRQVVTSLHVSLRLYYGELPPEAEDKIEIRVSPPKNAAEHRYRPKYSRFIPRSPRSSAPEFHRLGSSVEALYYVARQMPELKAIQETFVRWIDRDSLYEGGAAHAYEAFLNGLRDNPVLYRAILGPLTDPIIHKDGRLRDVLTKRAIKNLPAGEDGAKVYRLLHGTAMVNFTLLFRFRDANDRFAFTPDIEVLFGFGVHEKNERPSDTVVFHSKDPELVREFYQIFQTLRTSDFSRQLDLSRSDVFMPEHPNSDVLASWKELPAEEILRKIQGIARTSQAYQPQIRICVLALEMIASKKFRRAIKTALSRGVKVTIALWVPGKFTKIRESVIPVDASEAADEIEAANSAIKLLGSHENLSTPECTREVGSVSMFWIDDLIYFAPYWMGKDVAEGPHFLVPTTSSTGIELQEQWSHMVPLTELTSEE